MKTLLPILACLVIASAIAQADKPTLAITPVNVSPALTENPKKPDDKVALSRVVQSLQSQLIDSFGQTGKFNVISRTDLPSVVQEQVLGQSGNINASSAAKQGNVSGASYVLVVGIDDFELFTERANFASISREQQRRLVRVAAIARIYDSSTGALMASSTDSVTGEDFQQYFAFAEHGGDLETVIYTQTARALSEKIAATLSTQLFPAKVVAKTGLQITINQGSANGFNPQNLPLYVYAVGEEMIDPDSGVSLGKEEVLLGEAMVIRQDERITIAILQEDNGVQRGHIVRVVQ